jgi:hypothetical protein
MDFALRESMRLATSLMLLSLIVFATGCPDRVTRESTAAAATLDPASQPGPSTPPGPPPPPIPAASDGGVPAAPGLLDGGIIRDGGGIKDGMAPMLDGRANPS